MRIDPLGAPTPPPKAAAGTTTTGGARTADSSSSVSETESFTLTGELTALLSAARQSPEVRAEVIEAVAARLAAGELSTPEAAADAARALLPELPPPPSE